VIRWLALQKVTRFVAVVLGLVAVVAASGIAYAQMTDLPEDAVLRFDDRVVTQAQLEDRVDVLGALYGVQRPDGATGDQFDRDAAKSMAVSLVLEKEAADRDIEIADKAAQDQLDQLIEDQLTGGRDAFVDFLSVQGISEQDVLDEIKRQLATSRLVEEVTADVPSVSDDDVTAAFEDNGDRMQTPEARRLVNIVVESRTDADRVARLARAGGDFASLAATWSRDGSTRDKGGDLGFVTADQLDPAYAEAAFVAPLQTVFGPVQTQFGWNVGKVVGVRKSQPLTFDQVEGELRAELQNRARLDVWRDYLGDLLEAADVEYAAHYLPEDPGAPPADLPE
jgi:peptidyl-prolyl cis-trans isomerase C